MFIGKYCINNTEGKRDYENHDASLVMRKGRKPNGSFLLYIV